MAGELRTDEIALQIVDILLRERGQIPLPVVSPAGLEVWIPFGRAEVETNLL